MIDLEIILTAVFIAWACALVGSFLVTREMAMVGDAIAHAVLPGIVLAYLISGGRDSLWMLTGACLAGVFVTLCIEWVQKKARVQSDAAIGISYTFLFAIGVILVSKYGQTVDLDQDCVLYGEIAYVPLDRWMLGGLDMGPRQTWIGLGLFTGLSVLIFRGFRALTLTSFDPSYAATLGISVAVWHYALMGAVSLTTVVSFESVGAILVVALVVIPPATAYLFAKTIKNMILLALGFSTTMVVSGYYVSAWLDVSISGSMATTGLVQFLLVMGLKPLLIQSEKIPSHGLKSKG